MRRQERGDRGCASRSSEHRSRRHVSAFRRLGAARPGTPSSCGVGALLALVGTVLIVSSANALNMWWERETDGFMIRTKDRPLPAGRMSPDLALGFGLALGAVSVPMLWNAVWAIFIPSSLIDSL